MRTSISSGLGGVHIDPKTYSVLLFNVNHALLMAEIYELLEVCLFDLNMRPMIHLVVSSKRFMKAILCQTVDWVDFNTSI